MSLQPKPPERHWGPINVFKRRWIAFLVGGLIGAPLLGLLIGIALVYVMPKEYLGRVQLQIQHQPQDLFGYNAPNPAHTPTFLETEIQVITSKETLYEVIEELQLVKRWEDVTTPADAYSKIMKMLEPELVRGTDLISIEVYSTDPQKSVEIANSIARAYQKRRIDAELMRSSNALDMLNAQEILQEKKTKAAHQKMMELMRNLDRDENDRTFSLVESTQDERDEYEAAKRHYRDQNSILTDMKSALIDEKADLSLPRILIEIHETAERNEIPARPSIPLTLAGGVLIGGTLFFLPIGAASMYLAHAFSRP